MFRPYVYALVIGIPFMMGWFAYLSGMAGLAWMIVKRPPALGVILLGIAPYFLLQGNAPAAVPRYYLPIVPFLSLAAGYGLSWILRENRYLGIAVTASVVGYTGLVTTTQTARMAAAPQRAVIRELARLKLEKKRLPLNVGYPQRILLLFDTLHPEFGYRKGVRAVFMPKQHLMSVTVPQLETCSPESWMTEHRKWLLSNRLDAVLLPDRRAALALLSGASGREVDLFQRLENGELGFRLQGEYRTHFATESWYYWADPTLRSMWTSGIAGYRLYVKDDLYEGDPS